MMTFKKSMTDKYFCTKIKKLLEEEKSLVVKITPDVVLISILQNRKIDNVQNV